MSYCDDCGTKLSDGICPWCQEELYIATWQQPESMSEEFRQLVSEQEQAVEERRRKARADADRTTKG